MSEEGKVRGTIDAGNPSCLHCVVNYAIGAWAKRCAPRDDDGEIVLNMGHVIAKLAEVVGEHVFAAPEGAIRENFQRYAHECLEAAFEHMRTGKRIAVSLNEGPPS